MPSVYTRRGDDGTTGLFSGERLQKDSAVFNLIGAIDDVSSHIGVAICHTRNATTIAQLRSIQTWLYQIMGDIATLGDHEPFFARTEQAAQLETWIDAMDAQLEALTEFILPGGRSLAGAELHVCRTSCRAAERLLVGYDTFRRDDVACFINRLSDYFFTAARYVELEARYRHNRARLILVTSAICVLVAIFINTPAPWLWG